MTPMKAIREKCLDCCCGNSNEVKLCPIKECSLWEFRSGHNPHIKGRKGSGDPNFGGRMKELKRRTQGRDGRGEDA